MESIKYSIDLFPKGMLYSQQQGIPYFAIQAWESADLVHENREQLFNYQPNRKSKRVFHILQVHIQKEVSWGNIEEVKGCSIFDGLPSTSTSTLCR